MDDFDRSRSEETASKAAADFFGRVEEARKRLLPTDFCFWLAGFHAAVLARVEQMGAPAQILEAQRKVARKSVEDAVRYAWPAV